MLCDATEVKAENEEVSFLGQGRLGLEPQGEKKCGESFVRTV
jgi:hypothetical protein